MVKEIMVIHLRVKNNFLDKVSNFSSLLNYEQWGELLNVLNYKLWRQCETVIVIDKKWGKKAIDMKHLCQRIKKRKALSYSGFIKKFIEKQSYFKYISL